VFAVDSASININHRTHPKSNAQPIQSFHTYTMQFLNILALAAVAVAIPAPVSPVPVNAIEQRQTAICSGLGGTPLCCATDVLGLVVLDCYNRE
jgi:hypothetical protein